MLNEVILMGRFTKDPELKSTGTGTSVVSFSLACDRDYVGQGGNRETDFINCVAWKGTAEFISKHFQKGSMAAIKGRIQTRPYEEQDGKKRTATEVNVTDIYFADSKKKDDSAPVFSPVITDTDDDLPF